MGLSKIDLKNKNFDPQVYKYGGAFIYPLGFYFYTLISQNLVRYIQRYRTILKNHESFFLNIAPRGGMDFKNGDFL